MVIWIQHLLVFTPCIVAGIAVPVPASGLAKSAVSTTVPKPTPGPGGPADGVPADQPKDTVPVDLSKPLADLFKDTTFDIGSFIANEQKKEADVTQFQQLESVSGGLWNPNVTEVEKPEPITALVKRAPSPEIIKCLKKASVKYYTASHKSWSKYATPYNLRVKVNPDVIVKASDTKSIQNSIICASTHKMKVQARAGGHSYAAFSSGTKDGGMVIDLRDLNTFVHERRNRVIVVGAGTRLGNLGLGLLLKGEAISHGDCPSIGLAGHALHGGFGYSSRMWGLSTDAIIGLDVVTASAERLHLSEIENKDLYWAMRGAGDSLAIATKFYLRSELAPKNVVHYIYDLNHIYGDPVKMAKAFTKAQTCLQDKKVTDRRLGLTVRLATDSYRIAGYFYGSQSDFKTVETCLDKATGLKASQKTNPSKFTLENLKYADALSTIAGRTPVKQPVDANNVKSNFFAKSLMVPEDSPLSETAMKDYFSDVLGRAPNVKDQFTLTFRLMGGADSQIPLKNDDFSAICHRNTLWIVQHDGNTAKNKKTVTNFIEAITANLRNVAKGGNKFSAFAPFLDGSLSNSNARSAYFSRATNARINNVKSLYDPRLLFWNPHSPSGKVKV
ncbi:hypothetical protein BKA66DRAFT_600407 [Pyrenochaeta sp. MPI-SDFR-AT-0127]|nr:hypothetical protein BKA66DRAFT_600407 [Pyrenochaeta sp. MPI-SDFR-AT-0127]